MAWVFFSQMRGENSGLHGLGFFLTNEKIRLTTAQTCCNKEKKPRPFWTWVFLSWMRKVGRPLPKFVATKRKPRPSWTRVSFSWTRKAGQPSPKLAIANNEKPGTCKPQMFFNLKEKSWGSSVPSS